MNKDDLDQLSCEIIDAIETAMELGMTGVAARLEQARVEVDDEIKRVMGRTN